MWLSNHALEIARVNMQVCSNSSSICCALGPRPQSVMTLPLLVTRLLHHMWHSYFPPWENIPWSSSNDRWKKLGFFLSPRFFSPHCFRIITLDLWITLLVAFSWPRLLELLSVCSCSFPRFAALKCQEVGGVPTNSSGVFAACETQGLMRKQSLHLFA